jgi:predicted AlkP superfamily pyrophosphatase or phosphodiesterase
MKKGIVWSILTLLMSLSYGQSIVSNNERPSLVVAIVVDQMRYDYLIRYWDKYGNGGFKRMIRDGYNCRNMNYNYVPTYTGPGHASIFTGSTPSVHGIVANNWYRKNEKDTVYCVEDKSVKTIGATNESGLMSPHNLLTTTIADELKIITNFKSKTFGISMKDRGAILPVGHTANAAFWYDSKTGFWISSSYYMKQLPDWVMAFNNQKRSDFYLNKVWEPMLPIQQYTESTADSTPYEENYKHENKVVFPYNFSTTKAQGYEMIRRSPWGNSLTNEFAQQLIKSENLGKNGTTDFLSISFSCTDYVGHQFGTFAIETEDTYLRLDKDLEQLFNFLDGSLGLNNVLIFLTADHGASHNPEFLNDHKIPAGSFPFKSVNDSINKFLKTTYGNEKWINCFDNNQIFLNYDALNKKNIDVSTMSKSIINFLMQFKDVYNVLTKDQLLSQQYTDIPRQLIQNGIHPKISGDLIIILNPSVLDWEKSKGTTHAAPWSYDTHVPLLWMGWNIKHGYTDEEMFINDIAPTLSVMLGTAFPNGKTGKVRVIK